MNDSRPVCQSYKVSTGDIISFFLLFFADFKGTVKKRLIFFIFQFFSLIALLHLLGVGAQYRIAESLSQIVDGSVLFHCHLHIVLIWIYA